MRVKDKILISAVIPCYNDGAYIEDAVNSVKLQTHSPIEIIVVDDGSSISTKNVLANLESKIDLLIVQENLGPSKARNKGIAKAKGEFILVLDSDDYFEPTFCDKAIQVFREKREVKIISSHTKLHFTDGSFQLYKPKGGDLKKFLFGNHSTGSCLIRKSSWLEVGGYDETMRTGFEDWEFYIRILAQGGRAFTINEVLLNYRKRNDSTTKKANSERYNLWKYIFTKHSNIYCENFEDFLEFFLFKLKREEEEKIKNRNRLEFRLGEMLLKPLKQIKKLYLR
ncbi:glycosyltransferase [Salegentibacter mishustinae]|uniref:glycosyltransferase n=1 Tax=Salegentibacter mishustinae TaxID=270918 RepID=UPI0024936138|nr:glycosyltransferase [Salegentibacter mishustinae]